MRSIYISQLTFLRFLAAFLVVVFHSGKETFPFNCSGVSSIVQQGSIAVSFFFFLSGVVLALNYLHKPILNTKEFLIKRFARLYPVYLVAFVATLIIGVTFNNTFPKGGSLILQLISFQAWIPGICLEMNYPAWSISVEVFFYLMFPLLFKVQKGLKDKVSTILIIGFWIFSGCLHYYSFHFFGATEGPEVGQFILYFPLWHLNTFLMGILCAKYVKRVLQAEVVNYNWSRVLFIAGVALFWVVIGTDNIIRPYTHNGLIAPIFFLIVAGLATDKSMLTRCLGNKILVQLGNSSYALYILQWPIYMVLALVLGETEIKGSLFYLYLAILILVSVAVYQFFEKRMRREIVRKLI